ncbi:putative IRON-SULFUR-BINDING REDUCTASE domain protein [Mycobacterium xenopi 3993]|nr:putative IRON-SULFUR-BINDING REDUCTASE domain protein [Mycobacterium xenopi 3993]
MIFNVIWTYVLVRGSAVNNGTLPYGKAAFLSQLFGVILKPLGHNGNEVLETVACCCISASCWRS